MEEIYLKYSIEDFTQDLNFIKWVKRGENQDEWKSLIKKYPELASKIEIAKTFVESFQPSVKDVKEEEMVSVLRNIELFYDSYSKKDIRLHIRKMILRYAAVFVFLLALGSITSYFYFTRSYNKFPEMEAPLSVSNDAKLILPGGEEILLKQKQSKLEFDVAGKQVKIDQDSVVDYQVEDTKNEMAQVIIPFGKRSDIMLPDGSKVCLNAGSRLIFPQKFTNKERHVYLVGEAYFNVAKNKDVPFIVTLDNIDVTVLGTEFNMNDNNYNDELEVVLVEGGISLKENNSIINLLGNEIEMVPNQKAVYNKNTNKIQVESGIDVSYYTGWKEGIVEFRSENITNVFKQLSKYYNVKFVTEKTVELNQNISGKLDLKESIEDVLKVIADAAPVTYRIEEETIYINSKINYLPKR